MLLLFTKLTLNTFIQIPIFQDLNDDLPINEKENKINDNLENLKKSIM